MSSITTVMVKEEAMANPNGVSVGVGLPFVTGPQQPLHPPNMMVVQQQKAVWSKIHQRPGHFSYVPTGRHGHRAVAYKNFMIMFGGGNEGLFEDLSVLNLTTGEWTQPQVKGDIPPSRAAYGAVLDGHRILIFGGMEENFEFVDSLYELNIPRWEWKLLKPAARSAAERPCPRIGHSFTIIKDKVFMFGGITVRRPVRPFLYGVSSASYLKDLHVLNAHQNMQHGIWEVPITYGTGPSARESHSAVSYVSKAMRHNKIVIYGGMFGNRLGDLFTLDIDTMMWSQIKYEGRTFFPMPRSLHSASVVGDKMYVFGGWIPDNPREKIEGNDNSRKMWKCDKGVTCLDLKTMQWEKILDVAKFPEEGTPGPRAGHSAVVYNNKIYVWSGRDGYVKNDDLGAEQKEIKQACYCDFWKLDVQKPGTPSKVALCNSFSDKLVVVWHPVPGADGYILQLQEYNIPTAATVEAPVNPDKKLAIAPVGAPSTELVPVSTVSLQNNFVIPAPPVPRPPMAGIVPQLPSNSLQIPNANPPQLQNVNQRPAWPNPTVSPQIGCRPVSSSLQPRGAAPLNSVQPPPSNFVPPRPPQALPNFRSPLTQNSTAQMVRAPQISTPESAPSTALVVAAPQPSIAPQFNWQTLRPQQRTPLSRSELEEIAKLVAAHRQQPATPTISPSLAPPASAGLNPPIPLPQSSTQQSDSSLMPPPADVPTPTPSLPSSSTPTVPGNPPQLQLQPVSRPTVPSPGNLSQGPPGPQRHGNLVRILNHSPSAKNQQSSLTGSHGIPGLSSTPHQQPPKHGKSIIAMPSGKVQREQDNAIVPSSNLGLPPPIPVGPIPRATAIRLTSQQLQAILGSYGQSLRPGFNPIRLITPRQGVPNQDPTRTVTRFITYRLPNGNNVIIPTGTHPVGPAVGQFRMPVPVPIIKDDGKKRLAAEGMLRLAENQSQPSNLNAGPVPQQQVLQIERAPRQEASASLTPVVGGNDDQKSQVCGSSEVNNSQGTQQQQKATTNLNENCPVVQNNEGDSGNKPV